MANSSVHLNRMRRRLGGIRRRWPRLLTCTMQRGSLPPQAAEVAATLKLSDAEMRRLITLLLPDKILIRMGADALYIHQSALAQLRARISELRSQTLDVTRFKLLTGLSRKYAIPLLEYLDLERVTRKDGDQRLVIWPYGSRLLERQARICF
jgi:hypothetical protein